MNTYLTIITTILVLTQIIRLIQNAIQIKRYGEIERYNKDLIRVYKKLEYWLDREDDNQNQE